MIRRPPRSTPLYSSAASDVYKRQPQPTVSTQGNFRLRCERGIHPVAWTAFSHPLKPDALNDECPPHESIQVDSSRDDISTKHPSVLVANVELAAEVFIDLPRKERNLSFIVVLVVEETVSTQAPPGYTLDGSNLDDRLFAGSLTMVPKEVVPWRDIEAQYLDSATRYGYG